MYLHALSNTLASDAGYFGCHAFSQTMLPMVANSLCGSEFTARYGEYFKGAAQRSFLAHGRRQENFVEYSRGR